MVLHLKPESLNIELGSATKGETGWKLHSSIVTVMSTDEQVPVHRDTNIQAGWYREVGLCIERLKA